MAGRETNEAKAITSNLPNLDNRFESGGIPHGSVVGVETSPYTNGRLIVMNMMYGHDTLYLTTTAGPRRVSNVYDALKREITQSEYRREAALGGQAVVIDDVISPNADLREAMNTHSGAPMEVAKGTLTHRLTRVAGDRTGDSEAEALPDGGGEVQDINPDMIVIDTVDAIEETDDSPGAVKYREFLRYVSALAGATDAVAVVRYLSDGESSTHAARKHTKDSCDMILSLRHNSESENVSDTLLIDKVHHSMDFTDDEQRRHFNIPHGVNLDIGTLRKIYT